jgi:cobalamin-dependent methionine synthase I
MNWPPAQPDDTEKATLFKLLEAERAERWLAPMLNDEA